MATYEDCGHFKLPIADPGDCLTCEREASGDVMGPLVSFAGGRDNWRNGQTVSEHMRQMKADTGHLPSDRQPIPAGDKGRWV